MFNSIFDDYCKFCKTTSVMEIVKTFPLSK